MLVGEGSERMKTLRVPVSKGSRRRESCEVPPVKVLKECNLCMHLELEKVLREHVGASCGRRKSFETAGG